MPPTTAATPGTFIPHPSNNFYRAHTCDVLANCSTRTRRGPDRNSRRQLSARLGSPGWRQTERREQPGIKKDGQCGDPAPTSVQDMYRMCSQDPVCSATAGCPLAAVGTSTMSPGPAKARRARNRVTASRPVSSGWSELSAGRGTVSGGGKRWLPLSQDRRSARGLSPQTGSTTPSSAKTCWWLRICRLPTCCGGLTPGAGCRPFSPASADELAQTWTRHGNHPFSRR